MQQFPFLREACGHITGLCVRQCQYPQNLQISRSPFIAAFQFIKGSIFVFLKNKQKPKNPSSYPSAVSPGIYSPSSAKSRFSLFLNIPFTFLFFWKADFLPCAVVAVVSVALLISVPRGGKGVCRAAPCCFWTLLKSSNCLIHYPSWWLLTVDSIIAVSDLQILPLHSSIIFAPDSLPPSSVLPQSLY